MLASKSWHFLSHFQSENGNEYSRWTVKEVFPKIDNFNVDFKDDAHINKICIINNIKVLYTNVRSITSGTKREELQLLIKTENVDVVGITETWGRVHIHRVTVM